MKFSIVTPVYNGEAHITETIESVLSQEGDFEIEYIVQDGASSDKTIEIARSFETRIRNGTYPLKCQGATLQVHSEKDAGMYDAINKGFEKTSDSICAYINSDDVYAPGAFKAVATTFRSFPDIKWLKGITSYINEDGTRTPGQCLIYEQNWARMGVYGRNAYFILQDSVFWKRELWEKSGGMNSNYRYAGDYDLWIRFAQHEPLWSLNRPVSLFRAREGQLSGDMTKYRAEQHLISQEKGLLNTRIKLYFWLWNRVARTPLAPLYQRLYPILFHLKTKQCIEIDKDSIPRLHPVRGFIVS